jgi:hypothetical protein
MKRAMIAAIVLSLVCVYTWGQEATGGLRYSITVSEF